MLSQKADHYFTTAVFVSATIIFGVIFWIDSQLADHMWETIIRSSYS